MLYKHYLIYIYYIMTNKKNNKYINSNSFHLFHLKYNYGNIIFLNEKNYFSDKCNVSNILKKILTYPFS